MKTILLAVGKDDEHRLDELAETAAELAEPSGARVALAHVFSDDEYTETTERLSFRINDETTPDDAAKRYLPVRELGNKLEDAGVDFSWHGAIGDRADRIVELATDLEADIVVVGGRKRTPTGKAVFGSTAQKVMMNAPCPVTFVRGDEPAAGDEAGERKLLSRASR